MLVSYLLGKRLRGSKVSDIVMKGTKSVNRNMSQGIWGLGIGIGLLILWYLASGNLGISVYRIGQLIFIPCSVVVMLIGAYRLYLGLVEASNATSNDEVFDPVAVAETNPNLQYVSDEEAASYAEIEVASPFAPGTALPLDVVGQEVDFETGVWRETALGGLLASMIMIAFGAGSLLIFPFGAVLIASLGCLLGVFALVSRKPYVALGATFGNLAVLALAFAQSII